MSHEEIKHRHKQHKEHKEHKHTKKHTKKCDKRNKRRSKSSIVYGEFIRTFTFSGEVQLLPIVNPAKHVIFPTLTVVPRGVRYVENEELGRVGLLVPRGVYLVSWTLNPNVGASATLTVNGEVPKASNGYPYTQAVVNLTHKDPDLHDIINFEYLIEAPKRRRNLISLINSGPELFILNDIPNTRIANTPIGDTALITYIRIQRIQK